MMKIKNKTDLAIFTALEKINPDLILFTLENGNTLDIIFNSMYSERTLLNDDRTNEQYAILVNSLFAKKWDSAYKLFDSANTAISSLGISDNKTETIKENVTDNNTNLNQVSAYNVEDFANDSQNTINNNRIRDETKTTDYKNMNVNNFSVSWEYLQKNYLEDIIFNDVVTHITLRVYEKEI